MTSNIASSRQIFFSLCTAFAWAACATTPPVAIQQRVSEGDPVEVKTTEGLVLGATENGIHVFKGIPYAAPVAGLDRWRPPRHHSNEKQPLTRGNTGQLANKRWRSCPVGCSAKLGKLPPLKWAAWNCTRQKKKALIACGSTSGRQSLIWRPPPKRQRLMKPKRQQSPQQQPPAKKTPRSNDRKRRAPMKHQLNQP